MRETTVVTEKGANLWEAREGTIPLPPKQGEDYLQKDRTTVMGKGKMHPYGRGADCTIATQRRGRTGSQALHLQPALRTCRNAPL